MIQHIIAEGHNLVGIDSNNEKWIIKWCGNGSGSHWVVYPYGDEMANGFYVFIYDYKNPLKKLIEEAERRYGIYS